MMRVSQADINAVRASGLFDTEWYRAKYPDTAAAGIEAIEHYLWLGARLKRNPSPMFDTAAYLEANGDVEFTGMNPLLHYLRLGRQEGRRAFTCKEGELRGRAPARSNAPLVVYESHDLKMQGAPNSLYEIADGMKRRGSFCPYVSSPAIGPLAKLYDRSGIPFAIHGASRRRVINGKDSERCIAHLSAKYASLRPALIHVNTLRGFHCIVAADRVGIPTIWNIRESEDPDTFYGALPPEIRGMASTSFRRCRHMVFVAEASRSLWRNHLDGIVESSVIHNGLKTERLMSMVYGKDRQAIRQSLGLDEHDVLLLSVGTVSDRKGQSDIVEAAKLFDSGMRKRLVIAMVGRNSSSYSRRISSEVAALSQGSHRIFEIDESQNDKDRQRVAELYLAADLFVLSSRAESYPRVVLEAMSFGLAIVSTPCFGVKEQLQDRESVLFYEPGDAVELTAHLQRMANDEEERDRMRRNALARLSELNSYEDMLDAYEAVYRRVLGERATEASGGPVAQLVSRSERRTA